MGTHPIFESDFDCLTERWYLSNARAGSERARQTRLWRDGGRPRRPIGRRNGRRGRSAHDTNEEPTNGRAQSQNVKRYFWNGERNHRPVVGARGEPGGRGHFVQLANKYKHVKFVRGVAKQCVPNYPDKNLPTVFVYKNGNLAVQWIGGGNFGPNPPLEVVEWMLHEKTIITSDIENDPRKKTEDMFTRNVMNYVGRNQQD